MATIAQLNALAQALRTAGASFPHPATEIMAPPSERQN